GVVSHRAAHEAALAGEGWRGALSHYPILALAVALAPGEVVMIVDAVRHLGAQHAADRLHHPFPPSVRIPAGEVHRREISSSELAIRIDHRRRDVHSIPASSRQQIFGRGLMAEPARSQVYADPDVVLVVAKEVDVVVARSDGAELRARHLLEGIDISRAPRLVIVEESMLDALVVLAAEPERDLAADVACDGRHARLDVVVDQIEARRHVAASNVEADAADRDVLLIRDDAAHRLGVSIVAVGAEDA